MATESIGKTVHLTDEMADRIIQAQDRVDASPPPQNTFQIKWADSKQLATVLRKEYGYE